MLNTKSMSVAEIKEHIETVYNISKATVENIKGKSNLVNFLESLYKTSTPDGQSLDNILKETKPSNIGFQINLEESIQEKMEKPQITDPNWTEYILSLLASDEKDDKYPRTDGLRRLVEQEISPIKTIYTHVVQSPNSGNGMVSTVKTTIVLENGDTYEACADANQHFCPAPYNQHLSAIAETRAEGRAFRKILRLKNTTTKEEMASDNLEDDSRINSTQQTFIELMCKNDRLNINIKKLFAFIFPSSKNTKISQFSHSEAAQASEILSKFQGEMNLIPNDIKGFDSNWRD